MWIVKGNRAYNSNYADEADYGTEKIELHNGTILERKDNIYINFKKNGEKVWAIKSEDMDTAAQTFREIFDAINNNTKVLYID